MTPAAASPPAGRAQPVTLVGVSRRFDAAQAVYPLDLAVRAGEFLTLLGPSGCGKTTLLRMIAGLESVSTGRVLIGGADVTDHPPNRRDASIMFQDYALFPHMSVAENIAYGLKMRGAPAAARRSAVDEWLARIGLEGLGARRPHALSGGQRQRVALARALILEPGVLLLDEPLGALDAGMRRRLQGELRRLHRDVGLTFIAVTHDQDEALTMSDRIAVMRDGRIEQVGAPDAVYDRPSTAFVAQFLGRCAILDGIVRSVADGRVLVETPAFGAVLATGAAEPGARVRIALRPEGVTLAADGGARAMLRDIAFAGSTMRVTFVSADGAEIEADLPREIGLLPGAEMALAAKPGAATVLSG